MRYTYSLTDIKLFVAVAEAGNVSRGAAACFLAPSSASLRIKQLEENLGTQLFVRGARGVTLTRPGQVMLEHCRRCLAELEQMHANLAPYALGVKGHVTLFATNSAIVSYLTEDLEVFLGQNPSVRVSLEERTSPDIVAAVTEGRADIGVVIWDEDHPQLTFTPYREDELVIIAAMGSCFDRDSAVHFADCLDQPFVGLCTGTSAHTFIAGKAAALGRPLDMRIQVGGFQAVTALVRSGAGIAVVPISVVRDEAGIRIVRLRDAWATRLLKVCVRRDETQLSANARNLLDQLRRS